jgi:glutamyl-Q tRNA(Asp) synthetase
VIVERFAPSPTGFLHLGHAFSALTAFEAAQAACGRFLLRMEDIDGLRCNPAFVNAIYDDLKWLGIEWEQPVLFQSYRRDAYQRAVACLTNMGLTYRCSCTRKDITTALSAPQEGDLQSFGPDGVIYPGTCRGRIGMPQDAVRLDMRKAVKALDWFKPLEYREIGEGSGAQELDARILIEQCGDIVLARKDIGTSYHVAVVIDDAYQGVSHVTRGVDMAPATAIHVVLQRLLGLPTPMYRHHRLIRDEHGKRLAKRHDALAIRTLRDNGWSVEAVRAAVKPSA